ncbi:MAG: N-acetylmuramoyl-L-alanine amidase [Dehalococcoidia bacterium]
MSDPHRATAGTPPGRADGIAGPPRRVPRALIHRRARLIGAVALALALSVAAAGGTVLAQAPSRVTVREGETLSDIALRHYGDAAEAARIAAVNRILNPDMVFAGTELLLPAPAATSATTATGAATGATATANARRVTVAPGDTLTAIAVRVYGSSDYAPALAAANSITQPDMIRAGQEIILPASLSLPAGRGTGGVGALIGQHICIDPGHGGAEDSGAAYVFGDGRTLREADVVLDMSLALAQRLRAQGAKVTLTRQTDVAVELADRAYRCNVSDADITVSVHLNGVENRTINGALALHGKPGDLPLAQVMAGALQSGLFAGRDIAGISFGARHFDARVLLYTAMPAVLVEPSFLTNPIEANALLTPAANPSSRRAQIVREIERGIVSYLR